MSIGFEKKKREKKFRFSHFYFPQNPHHFMKTYIDTNKCAPKLGNFKKFPHLKLCPYTLIPLNPTLNP
jgi:hypothetical protein